MIGVDITHVVRLLDRSFLENDRPIVVDSNDGIGAAERVFPVLAVLVFFDHYRLIHLVSVWSAFLVFRFVVLFNAALFAVLDELPVRDELGVENGIASKDQLGWSCLRCGVHRCPDSKHDG